MATPVPVLSRIKSFFSVPPKVFGRFRPASRATSTKRKTGSGAAAKATYAIAASPAPQMPCQKPLCLMERSL